MQRVLSGKRLELADPGGGPARLDLLGEQGDGRLKPQLLEPARERPREVAGVGERRPAPQRQGLGNGALGDEPLEAQRVHVVRPDREPVAGRRLLHDPGAAQGLACPRDQGLQRVRHVGGGIEVPDGLGERAGAHRLPARQGQPGDESAQPRPGHGDRRAVVVVDLEQPQDRDPHSSIVPVPHGIGGQRRFLLLSEPAMVCPTRVRRDRRFLLLSRRGVGVPPEVGPLDWPLDEA